MSTANLPEFKDTGASYFKAFLDKALGRVRSAARAHKPLDKSLCEDLRTIGRDGAYYDQIAAEVPMRAAWKEQADRIPALRAQSAALCEQARKRREALEKYIADEEAAILAVVRDDQQVCAQLDACLACERKLREGRQSERLDSLKARVAQIAPERGTLRDAIRTADQALAEIKAAAKRPAAIDDGTATGATMVAFQMIVPTAEKLSAMRDHFDLSKRANSARLEQLDAETKAAEIEIAALEAAQLEV